MSKHRRAARIDVNQPLIVDQLRSMGMSVQLGMDDILVGWEGKTFWFEIKDPEKTLKKDGTYRAGTLKPSQEKLLDSWGGQYNVVHSVEEIVDIVMNK